ncbi:MULTISPECIES: PAS domain-containing sensor histidine kinase [Paraburkholderia]|uniref:histidine kinase n=1 Tax=Paraburkholderia megapolitana TaxID=420953 RepID=A0A1I3UTN2_9BURK|nr:MULTISPECIES: PAS domain-containing sensor histidine kinase [Paraburkholderia]MCX4163731.1 PAS domain-containing sensor histidine kinase [Paraburkholderia megapolitana]MDN7159226.1 PAS domain-containing sensor histidine kinase [Paraburkholderia sp. CHISQ3]MDQ6496273.1 PAS domain-containing sensor histidine kinase [Paraburkholderia megapolitana]QDQ82372.1 PAS domain-containing sensor histidine kinase [Paraburkholderia megapolitana]SFJ86578.1 multi-sensor signal transduction histidine kinase 
MLNSVRRVTSVSSIVARVLVSTVGVTAVLLLVLLAAASANTEFFDRYYGWLYAANIAVALIFMLIVTVLVGIIIMRLRRGKFGTRLLAKLAFFFALVGVVPGGIIYVVSYQFVSRSIESWFDVNVETALTSGLNLGRGMLDASLSDLQTKARLMADQIASADAPGTTLTLLRLRDQFSVQDATIVAPAPPSMSGATPGMRVVAQASSNYSTLVPSDVPTQMMIDQARGRGYAAIEGEVDGDPAAHGPKGALRLRVVTLIPDSNASLLQPAERFLQLTQPVSPTLARNADAVQRAYREYQEKSLGRTGLRKMYIGTLTLALFLATFIAMMIALALGNQLARPLFLLAQGTKEVTEGDYTPKREIKSRDELGFLTQSFNAMTRQLSEARAAVENNRIALEHSKAYLESILANLTAGVFVFDRQFRLTTANRGAERIFRQQFQAVLGSALDRIGVLAEFGAMVRKAFADREAASRDGDDRGHWQQQFSVEVPGETDPLTLLVRGARLFAAAEGDVADVQTAGYVVVFDDISDVISAQRSIAWGEVARRLAHEIKNPLTPIQLSAERLQMKLADKLGPSDADVLKRGATTIVNQVAAMKQMVDNFRDYARTPPAVLANLQLNELVSEVMTLYGIEEGKSAIAVELAELPVIRGDATQLRQVIHNLLQNAQDAVAEIAEPRVLLETRTVEYGDPDAEGKVRIAVRLTVTDNGPGFPARILTRAFEPYVTTKAKGTGLGLAMVKKIVDEHGARIDIRNRLKAGDVVEGAQISILFLQLADDTAAPDAGPQTTHGAALQGTTKATVQTRAA